MRRTPSLAGDLLAIDVGNSKVLSVLIRAGAEQVRWRVDYGGMPPGRWGHGWSAGLQAAGARVGCDVPVLVASVAPARARVVVRRLQRAGVRRIHPVSWRDPWPFGLEVREPATLGVDRMANVAGLVALGSRSGLAIDAGTAVTVDVLERGRLHGGLILPGGELLARALHDCTSQLPRVDVGGPAPPLVGRDTRSALRAGIHHGVARGVGAIAARLLAQLGPGACAVFTGAQGAQLAVASELPAPRYEPDLLILGLRALGARLH